MTVTRAPLVLLALLAASCAAPHAAPPRGLVRPGTPPSVDIPRARGRGMEQAFEWQPWSSETFQRAQKEGKLILIDGAAEWCHWCHVMDETTYRDPEVGRILREHFIAIRIDVDARPDIAERYQEWGWPATILLNPDAHEIGKYRGYIPADELKTILQRATGEPSASGTSQNEAADTPATPEALPWITALATLKFDRSFDPQQGSWGRDQKAPLGENLSFEVARAARGDKSALARARLTLEKQRALIDPVWGGIYQYSAGPTWDEAHYEKLMTFQAHNLEAYARAHALTRDPSLLADARAIERYMNTFLSNAEGAFLVSQDADLGAHDPKTPFVDGHVYYALGDQARRKLGIPRIDDHVYARENGLAIGALSALYEASRDPATLARARRAADLMISSLVAEDGAVRRKGRDVRYLADAASLGFALARLGRLSGERKYIDTALRIAKTMERDLEEHESRAFLAHTPDPDAQGIFSTPERPFFGNILAARMFAALAKATGDEAYRARGLEILAAVATPRELSFRARTLGGFLLAADDLEVVSSRSLETP